MNDKRCIKCKKILVGKHFIPMCSSCKRLIGKIATGVGGTLVLTTGAIIKYTPKKKI